MASDRDLDDFDRDELIKSGKDLVAELSPNSTGRFIAPLGGSYLDMKRIHQSQIKQGLQVRLLFIWQYLVYLTKKFEKCSV